MGNKLGIIATDVEMKKAIEKLYPDETQSGKFIIEILDQEQIDEQGKWLENKGASVIIGRSGTYDRSVENVSVPLLRLRVTTADIFNALIEGTKFKKKINLIIWEGIFFDKSWLKMISDEVEIYSFKNGGDIEKIYIEAISGDSDCVIVGGGVVCSFARRDDISSVFLNASDESIIEIINHAEEVLVNLKNAQYQHELLSKMLDNVRDAVIAIDENEEVQLFNERAQNILKVGMVRIIGKKLSEVLPYFSFLKDDLMLHKETKDELLRIRSLVITYSTSLIWEDHKIKGILLTFQDTTRLQMLEQKIRRELNKKGLVAKYNFKDIVYVDETMSEIIRKAKMIGRSESAVVIYGESGTGKELMAQSIHNISDRNKAPFVAINCAALSESLLESELFGYEEGAFTGARKGGKPGLFELAHGGTIFLDEINSISKGLQGKLLRVIEEKEVMRLGSDYIIPLNVRIISASNEDLKAMIQEKTFRSDLFYRLNSFEIIIPPLRERRTDIEPLFRFFLKEFQLDEKIKWPSKEDFDKLILHDWLGNVRELRNVAERYVLFNEIDLFQPNESQLTKVYDDTIDLKEIYNLIDERIISQLIRSGLTKNEIAKKLGISRATLWNKTKNV
ncbi:sigma 54-interacting transcriptional regulator [Clostridiaceae bacterium HSG29]|nr:sigma 54-interacting transcriptional regulator [Clostridiaceae bacterium HSG29]